jgi:hypothetical protein
MIDEKELKNILINDPLNLLSTNSISKASTPEKRLLESFKEINEFYEKENHIPQKNGEIIERIMFSRLEEIKKNPNKVIDLKKFDKYNLLGEAKKIEDVSDIIENDYLGILDDENENIFDLKHVKLKKTKTDFVARRKQCDEFYKYEENFKTIQKEISKGKRKLIMFKEQDLKEGNYFILDGLLLFLQSVNFKKRIFKDKTQGSRTRIDDRIKCIFENGLESNMFLRSLQKQLYSNGKTVTNTNNIDIDEFNRNFSNISSEDKKKGQVYILSSFSENYEIKKIKNLYKIGYCTTSIRDRIKGCENDPTFLMSKVKIVESYDVYNCNPIEFETLIHSFFQERCLDIEIADSNGIKRKPKEWYVVPLRVISRVIELIDKREISKYKYDSKIEDIVKQTT